MNIKQVLSISRLRPQPPAINSVVLGTVIRLSPLQATLSISVVDGVPLPAGEEFTGVIRTQDVRATEKDRVKIGDSFRGGDVVRGVVISLGDARSYFVTTARNDLGVVFAVSEAGKTMVPVSWKEMRCPETGKLEKLLVVVEEKRYIYPLRRDLHMSLDDNTLRYSSFSGSGLIVHRIRSKLLLVERLARKVADMLAETRAELDEFQVASRELEAELEAELQRTEKAQQDLKVKVARAESERDEWKSKFMSLQTTHNTATTTLQRELDKLRQEHQQTKVQLRELEMGNDDLERNERAVSSSLADIESKYSRALEEKILLEHELLDKANLEEECQRLKDELRDANVEVSILKDQLAAQPASDNTSIAPSSLFPQLTPHSEDNLLNTPAPADLQLEDLTPSTDSLPTVETTSVDTTPRAKAQSALVNRSGAVPYKSNISTPPGSSGIARSSTLPSFYSPRSPNYRPPTTRNPSAMSTNSTSSTTSTSKNKGVQMVSEMRARVRNLEQKIHTRVPRLRMGSITGRPNANALAASTVTNGSTGSNKTSVRASWESLTSARRNVDNPKRSSESESDKEKSKKRDSTGWVLIMEDSPSPPKPKPGERRRASSPLGMIPFRPAASTSAVSPTPAPTSKLSNPLNQSTMPPSGLKRPQSRLSGGSTTISIPSSSSSSSSRPATPTFLPIPSGGLYAHSSTAGASGLKRSTGPSAPNNPYAAKRSSLGGSGASTSVSSMPPPPEPRERERERPTTMPPPPRPGSGTPSSLSSTVSSKYSDSGKMLPSLPSGAHANVTIRAPKPLPSVLSQSRIGRPSSTGVGGGRKSGGGDAEAEGLRPRSGSTAAM
ncbi:hypothetical protein MVEN_01531000 [Mycena venus]|uniref:S1 motif domain-containing protein n=1 Tax=Mycena venus TaxID=2733690 RepID=A0A8H6XWQ6_9AGAR|nr:hypothetical protein MVEN_01531000 [Mycena venus]